MRCRECGADKPETSQICTQCGAAEPADIAGAAANPSVAGPSAAAGPPAANPWPAASPWPAANPWPAASPWAAAGSPTAAGQPAPRGVRLRIAAAIVAITGAVGAVVACALPVVSFRGGSLSIFSAQYSNGTYALAVEPVLVAAIGITAAVLLLAAKRPSVRWLATGSLFAIGTQTIGLFFGYQFADFPPTQPGIAAAIGMVDGVVFLAAGVMSAIALAEKPVPQTQPWLS
jgi:hypothetical protein